MIRSILIDLLIFSGLGCIGYGIWQFSPPVAFIAIGVLLFSLGLGAISAPRRQAPTGERE